MTVEESVVKAVDTSGRAVLFAGGTVVIALLGMLVLGMSFLDGMAIASATTVVATVLAAVTLLPALLGFLGMRTLSRRERAAAGRRVRRAAAACGSAGRRVVQRRPGLLSAVAIVLIGVLTLPVFSLRLGSSDAGNDPSSTTTRQAYDMLATGFGPGFNGPLQLVARDAGPGGPAGVRPAGRRGRPGQGRGGGRGDADAARLRDRHRPGDPDHLTAVEADLRPDRPAAPRRRARGGARHAR